MSTLPGKPSMSIAFDPANYPRRYSVSPSLRSRLRVIWLSASIILGVADLVWAVHTARVLWPLFDGAVYLIFSAFFYEGFNGQVELGRDALVVMYPFARSTKLRREQISGVKRCFGLHYAAIVGADSGVKGGGASFPENLRTDPYWDAWFADLPDAQNAEFRATELVLLADSRLGATVADRQARLLRICRFTQHADTLRWLMFTLIIAAAGEVEPCSDHGRWLLGVLLLPWVPLFLAWRQPWLYRLAPTMDPCDARVNLALAVQGCTLASFLIVYKFPDYAPGLWLPAIILGTLLACLFGRLHIWWWKSNVTSWVAGGLLFLYSLAFILGINRSVDSRPMHRAQFRVAAAADGLRLPLQGANNGSLVYIFVPHWIAERAVEGDTICIELHRGLLGIRWRGFSFCPAAEQTPPYSDILGESRRD